MTQRKAATETATTRKLKRTRTSAPLRLSAARLQPAPTHAQIAERAYELYRARGGVHGFHVEDWLRAEAELLQR